MKILYKFSLDELDANAEHPNPCMNDPCGPNAECEFSNNGEYKCRCLSGMINHPPNCRPECSINSHCPGEMLCINYHCKDPCAIGVCGTGAECTILNHKPLCTCPNDYDGDPYNECVPNASNANETNVFTPCDPDPCTDFANTMCVDQNGVGICVCLPNFYRNSENDDACIPKCSRHVDCPLNHVCIQSECHDPCKAICPENAECHIAKTQIAICTCKSGYTGDPYQNCVKIQREFLFFFLLKIFK